MMAFWLLLASILAHALLPVGSPLARTSGSAFSATTAEVALSPSREDALSDGVAAARPSTDTGDGHRGPPALLLLAASLFFAAMLGRRPAPHRPCTATAPIASSPRQSFDARAPPRL